MNKPMSAFARILIVLLFSSVLIGCNQNTNGTSGFTHTPEPILPTAISVPSDSKDVMLLSIEENGYAHLFIVVPGELPLMRLTAGAWNDISPSLSPDGTRLAFASDRDGFWDIYLLDLQTGGTQRLTDTPQYDAFPTWSPDLAWVAYESYIGDNLEIVIHSLSDSSLEPINLTYHSAADTSPVWSPDGRQIVFISNRGGDSDVWMADLDRTDASRFIDLSNTPRAAESHPVWKADGSQLAWASEAQDFGQNGIYLWNKDEPNRAARWIGDGDWPAWSERGEELVVILDGPNLEYLISYDLTGRLLLTPTLLPGHARGLIWPNLQLPDPLPAAYQQAAAVTPSADWAPAVTPAEDVPNKRWYVVPLPNVQAPYPQMHDLVDESFTALRGRVIREAGWDALASLENAYVPITTALDPGLGDDWSYTGRAFTINSLMVNAGWMVAVREQVGAETYWRLYLRAQQQDGSQGQPIQSPPWDLNARFDLDPRSYEAGGQYIPVPPGYWVDFTSLSNAYGWDRLPALPNWRTYYAGTRFTEFALTGGMDWYTAMLELYPGEVLVTPTRILPPTATASRTPIPSDTPRPSRTPGASPTASGTRPPTFTLTPAPPTITLTPSPTPPTVIPTF
jgi:TolB protein